MNKPVTNVFDGARRIRSSAMLSVDEERALICAWQEHGDRRARDRLIHAFAPLAASVAKRFTRGAGEADPDLLQQARLGLLKAVDRFDPKRGFRFSTYAIWWVRAEIQDYVRANRSVVRRPNSAQARAAARHIAVLDSGSDANARKDRDGADKKLADALGVDVSRATDLRAQVTGSDSSLNTPLRDGEGADRLSLLVDPASMEGPQALKDLETVHLRQALAKTLATLPERERDIIIATQVTDPPATLEGLGAQYGISKERVRQLRERGFERLRSALAKQGLDSGYFY